MAPLFCFASTLEPSLFWLAVVRAILSVALLQHDFLQMHVIIPHINVKLRDVGIIAAICNSPFVKAKVYRQKNPEID